jgi:hypothetical protein
MVSPIHTITYAYLVSHIHNSLEPSAANFNSATQYEDLLQMPSEQQNFIEGTGPSF